MTFLTKIFGERKTTQELLDQGAVIIDVRTPAEYAAGHLKKSINIPLDQLAARLNKLDNSKPVITCCASGMRSASAKRLLKSNGFAEVKNGGSWSRLGQQID